MNSSTAHRHLDAGLLPILAALAMLLALVAPPAEAQTDPDPVSVDRYAGTQRFDTAQLIAEDTYDAASTVVVAAAEDWPDALAGSYLAGLFHAPVLLVSRNAVPTDTLEALDSLDTTDVVLLGGVNAISAANAETLEEAGYAVTRLHGTTRYETSTEAALQQFQDNAVGLWEGERTAIVATGEHFADALVAGAVASSESFPVLLTPTARLHPAVADALTELGIERVIIPGGFAAVSEETEQGVEDLGIETTRVHQRGQGRWETAIAFADFAVGELGFAREHINVATGADFADALAMGPHAGTESAPLLLTPGADDAPTASLSAWLRLHACEISSIHVAGGEGAVTEANAEALAESASDCQDRIGVRIQGDSAPPGATVKAFFTVRDETALRAISVTGACVQPGDIWTMDTVTSHTTAADDIEAGFVLLPGAAPGPCEVTFELRYQDGSTRTLTIEIEVEDPGRT